MSKSGLPPEVVREDFRTNMESYVLAEMHDDILVALNYDAILECGRTQIEQQHGEGAIEEEALRKRLPVPEATRNSIDSPYPLRIVRKGKSLLVLFTPSGGDVTSVHGELSVPPPYPRAIRRTREAYAYSMSRLETKAVGPTNVRRGMWEEDRIHLGLTGEGHSTIGSLDMQRDKSAMYAAAVILKTLTVPDRYFRRGVDMADQVKALYGFLD